MRPSKPNHEIFDTVEHRLFAHIPFMRLCSPQIFETTQGLLGAVIQLWGVDFATLNAEALARQQQHFHRALMQLPTTCSVYCVTHRVPQAIDLDTTFDQPLAQNIHQAYQQQFKNKPLYANQTYLVLMTRALQARQARFYDWVSGKHARTHIAKQRAEGRIRQWQRLQDTIQQMQISLSCYKPHILGTIDEKLGYSELLSFLGYPLNGGLRYAFRPMGGSGGLSGTLDEISNEMERYPCGHIGQYLSACRIRFDHWIQFQNQTDEAHWTFAAIVTIKRYPSVSSIRMLQSLLNLNCRFIMTQSFIPVEDGYAQRYIQRKLIRLLNVNDPAFSEQALLTQARDRLATGELMMGYHHHTFMLLSSDEQHLKASVASAKHCLRQAGIVAVRETIGQEAAFWSQLPGNFNYIARASLVSSENFSDFSAMHRCLTGYRDKNHLGQAVTVLESSGKTPYFFNYHQPTREVYPTMSNDAESKKKGLQPSLGHSLIVGSSYAGKTVFLTFMDAQISRYKGRSFYFDRDRSAEIYIRAMGGDYFILSPEYAADLRLNPFQLADSKANRHFLHQWMCQLCRSEGVQHLTPKAKGMLRRCVDYAYDCLAKPHRRLTHVCRLLPMDFPYWPSLRRWLNATTEHTVGEYAYLFDHPTDQLGFENARIGIDMTYFMDQTLAPAQRAIMMYLLHRIEQGLDGRLTSILLDEGWQYFNDPSWCALLKRWLPTLRKYNAHIVLATQSIQSLLDSPVRAMMLDNTATQVIFTNPAAQSCDYVTGLHLTQHEFELIRDTDVTARYFLVKQNQESIVCRLNLDTLSHWMPILSADRRSIAILDKMRRAFGDDPTHWLPPLLEALTKPRAKT